MSLLILIPRANIRCILDTTSLYCTHIAAHIHHTQVRIIQVFGQPARFNQKTTALHMDLPNASDNGHENRPAASGLSVLTKWAGVPKRSRRVTPVIFIDELGVWV